MNLKNKKVLITGGSSGIGKATAQDLIQAGATVIITGRNLEKLDAAAKEIGAIPMAFDVSDFEVIPEKVADVVATMGGIDVLINNAGVFLPGEISEEEEGRLETMIETNLYSAYHLTRALLPIILPKKQGHIFNICSIASKIAYPNGGSYSISKFALLGFSKVLREELKEKGIKVTAILPGATWSHSWKDVDLPDDRLMQAADIAKTVYCAYTLSPSAVIEDIVIRPQLGDLKDSDFS